MPSAIEEALELLKGRLGALAEEQKRIEAGIKSLGGKKTDKRGPGRPPGSGAKPKTRARRKGTRADQAVALVEKEPGITASKIAKALKIKPNYLYRVLGELEKEKRIKKQGREYHPVG